MREHIVYNTASRVLHVQDCSRVKLMNKDNIRLLTLKDELPDSKVCNLCKKRLLKELNAELREDIIKVYSHHEENNKRIKEESLDVRQIK